LGRRSVLSAQGSINSFDADTWRCAARVAASSERLDRAALDRSNQGGMSNQINPDKRREPAAMTIINLIDTTRASGLARAQPG